MSLADSAHERDDWQHKANAIISQIEDLRRELGIALRQQPAVPAAWRIVDADLRCIEARDQLRMAQERVRQIN